MSVATPLAPPEEGLLTADEFEEMTWPDDRPRELVRGKVVIAAEWMAGRELTLEEAMPRKTHGAVSNSVAFELTLFVRARDLGTVCTCDTFVRVELGEPEETDRGADVSFYSWDRVPRGVDPDDAPECSPELVFEVRSPTDRPGRARVKFAEYLRADVKVVVWVEPRHDRVTVFTPDGEERVLEPDDEFEVPEVLPGFRVPVKKLLQR